MEDGGGIQWYKTVENVMDTESTFFDNTLNYFLLKTVFNWFIKKNK